MKKYLLSETVAYSDSALLTPIIKKWFADLKHGHININDAVVSRRPNLNCLINTSESNRLSVK